MRLSRSTHLLFALLLAPLSLAKTVDIYVAPVTSTSPPSFLAQISYDVAAPSEAEILSYEPPPFAVEDDRDADSRPTLAPDALVRVGIYDPASKSWASSTSAAAAENFDAKRYKPTVLLTVDSSGAVAGVAVRGARIDAGATRDFGPSVMVTVEGRGVKPTPNRPITLDEARGKDGKQADERTLLQK